MSSLGLVLHAQQILFFLANVKDGPPPDGPSGQALQYKTCLELPFLYFSTGCKILKLRFYRIPYRSVSHLRDSNSGPLLYESIALPAELRWRMPNSINKSTDLV